MSESKKNRAVEVIRDEKEPVVPMSQTKEEFAALIEAYKIKNPAKYAVKKAALEAKLAAM